MSALLQFWHSTPFWLIEVVWLSIIIPWVILERRSPVATLAWIVVLAWLPALGGIIFYFLGPRLLRKRRKRRQVSKRLVEDLMESEDTPTDSRATQQLALLGSQRGGFSPAAVDSLQLFLQGDDCFDAIVEAISAAKKHIHLSYYIFEPDVVGQRICAALEERAQHGVEVRVLVDAIGSWSATGVLFQRLRKAGAKVAVFNPPDAIRLRLRFANFRSHRKIVVVDGNVGFTGGMNISLKHSAREQGNAAWRDTHLRFSGDAVAGLQRLFFEDWEYATGEFGRTRGPDTRARYFEGACCPPLEALVQIVASGPDDRQFPIYRYFFAAIATAQQRVWITTPYFVPDEPILEALQAAAMRGVDVVLLVPKRGDNVLVDTAARSYFPELLQCGVKIWLYQPRVLHAKTMVVDEELAVVGTANLDNRSFRLNFEVIAAVYDRNTTDELARAFEDDLKEAQNLRIGELYRSSLLTRFAESSARLLAPLL